MFVSEVLSGITIGFPVMATVGPISLLLLNRGKDHGARHAMPAALGVAGADLTYSALAAVAGSAMVAVLAPIAIWLKFVGVAVVVVLAWQLAKTSRAELVELRRRAADLTGDPELLRAVAEPDLTVAAISTPYGGEGAPSVRLSIDSDSFESAVGQQCENVAEAEPRAQGWRRLAVNFYGLTLMNPLSIVLLSAIVITGGRGVGTAGWAVGMTVASLMAHGGFVILGSVLRKSFSQVGLARMGLFSSAAMVFVAAHLVVS